MVDESHAVVDRLGVFLELSGRAVLVVGGGRVGQRRVASLLDAGADVTLVSPHITEDLAELSRRGEISWEQREYESSDLLSGDLPSVRTVREPVRPGGGDEQAVPQREGEEVRRAVLQDGVSGRTTVQEGRDEGAQRAVLQDGVLGRTTVPDGGSDHPVSQSGSEGAHLGVVSAPPGRTDRDPQGRHRERLGQTDLPVAATSIGHESDSSTRCWLVHTATGTAVDALVAQDAEKAGVWCIRADSGTDSIAVVGAVSRGPDGIQIAVVSGDPGRSSRIARSVSQSLSTGALPIRRTRPELAIGWVALVGGGPGEPGLLTLRGRQLLALADVVVTDRLGPISVLEELEDDVRIVDVGKSPGYHPVPQDEINEILVVEAKAGLRVVRLKGGDPFVLGRGAEEARFCQEHDVPVEWVPGVTSAVSVPAAAGIPVTHRGMSPAFIVASGHESSEIAAATPPETTVLLLMGVLHLAETAELLMDRGRGAGTPVAIIEKGWTPAQRTTRTILGSCAEAVGEHGIRPPAVVVVGPAATLADVLGPVSAVVAR